MLNFYAVQSIIQGFFLLQLSLFEALRAIILMTLQIIIVEMIICWFYISKAANTPINGESL